MPVDAAQPEAARDIGVASAAVVQIVAPLVVEGLGLESGRHTGSPNPNHLERSVYHPRLDVT